MQWALLAGLLLASGCSRSDLSPPALLRALPSEMDVGFADCGGGEPEVALDIANDGGTTLLLDLRAAAPFQVFATDGVAGADGTLSIDIAAGASSSVTVRGPAAAMGAQPGQVTKGVLHVVTRDGGGSVDVALSSTVRGALFQISPSKLDLGKIPVPTTSPPQPLTITNSGNAVVTLHSGSSPNPDFTVSFADATLGPGDSAQGWATFFASAPGATQVTVPLAVDGAVCGDAPTVDLTARGVEGAFGESPGSLDFGQVPCGSTGQPQTVTLLNTGDAPYGFQASFAGTGFTVTPSSGTVTTSTTLTVQPAAVPSVVTNQSMGDTLTILTDIPNDIPHDVPVHEVAYGAILSLNPTNYSFGKSDVGTKKSLYSLIQNAGNAQVDVSAKVGSFEIPTTTIYPYQSGGGVLVYSPEPAKLGLVDSATLALSVVGPICAPPPSIQVDGRSHDNAFSVVALDDATCVIAGFNASHVYCWGSNAKGQFGTSSPASATTPFLAPVQVYNSQIAGGGAFVIIGSPWLVWGTVNGKTTAPSPGPSWNGYSGGGASDQVACVSPASCMGKGGYLGDGTTNDSSTFVWLPLSSSSLDTGFDGHTCTSAYGGLACWGPDDWGQLGDGKWGSSQLALSPVITSSLSHVEIVAAGDGFTCGYQWLEDNVICWGKNVSGECGMNPSSMPVLSPNTIVLGSVYWLAAGRDFTCAGKSDKTVWCWGANGVGQLGDGSSQSSSTSPVQVSGLTNSGRLSAGGRHACDVTNDSRVLCWGQNTSGELGNGTTTDSSTPVVVTGFE